MFDFLQEILDELKTLSNEKRPVIPDEKVFINLLPVIKRIPTHLIIVVPEVVHALEMLKESDREKDVPPDQLKVAKDVAKSSREALRYIRGAKLTIKPEFKREHLQEMQQKNNYLSRLLTQCSMIQKRSEDRPILFTYDETTRDMAYAHGLDTYLKSKNGTEYIPSMKQPTNIHEKPKRGNSASAGSPSARQTSENNANHNGNRKEARVILEEGKTGLANRTKTKRPVLDFRQFSLQGLFVPLIVGVLIIAFMGYILNDADTEVEMEKQYSDLELPFENVDVELTDIIYDREDQFRLEYELVNRNEHSLYFGYIEEEKDRTLQDLETINQARGESEKLTSGELIISYKDDTIKRISLQNELRPKEVRNVIISGNQAIENIASFSALIQDGSTGEVRVWEFRP